MGIYKYVVHTIIRHLSKGTDGDAAISCTNYPAKFRAFTGDHPLTMVVRSVLLVVLLSTIRYCGGESLEDLPRSIAKFRDQGFIVPCGYISCNVTYQYCYKDITDTPECYLCSGICARDRVGTNRLYIATCLKKCPVFWYRQLEKENARNIAVPLSVTTTTGATTSNPENLSVFPLTEALISSIAILLVIVIILGVIICLLVSKKRKYRSRQSRKEGIKFLAEVKGINPADEADNVPADPSQGLLPKNTDDPELGLAQPIHHEDRKTSTTGLAPELQTKGTNTAQSVVDSETQTSINTRVRSNQCLEASSRLVTHRGSGDFNNEFQSWPLSDQARTQLKVPAVSSPREDGATNVNSQQQTSRSPVNTRGACENAQPHETAAAQGVATGCHNGTSHVPTEKPAKESESRCELTEAAPVSPARGGCMEATPIGQQTGASESSRTEGTCEEAYRQADRDQDETFVKESFTAVDTTAIPSRC